mmetsp:Transcript_1070/g.1765  ORF Transcript_1070/g.1765 Transcript_1070/m.1765 type:complete len:420 (+) Transcript_1070:61-1320(+)
MKPLLVVSILIAICLLAESLVLYKSLRIQNSRRLQKSSLQASDGKRQSPEDFKISSQIARLNAVAAKLRAEAAELEAEQREIQALNLADAFRTFDTNNDGSISVQELREGLANALESSISEEQALKIMKVFDTSGDGALQMDEFAGVEAFRRKLDQILQDEKDLAFSAKREAEEAKLAAEKAEAIAELINNQTPTQADRILSGLPYLLPLLDALPYGKNLIENTGVEYSPFFQVFALLYNVYQTIPFSGLIAFFSLNVLTNNLRLNRLIRFNIQQAILIDIALIFPGILGAVIDIGARSVGIAIPGEVSLACSSLTFAAVLALFLYSVASSWLGIEPDKIPIISARVKRRVPTTKEFVNMFDEDGNFKPPPLDEEEEQKLEQRNRNVMRTLEEADAKAEASAEKEKEEKDVKDKTGEQD